MVKYFSKMDYEKKYKDALERARKVYNEIINNDIIGFPGQITDIFPELAESEDERIRKKLIDTIGYFRSRGINQNLCEEFFAYLEKQKAKERLDRMAPIYNDKESFESALEKAWKYYNDSASRTVDSFEDDYIECVFSKGFREGFLYKEKQKEEEGYEAIPVENTLEYKLGFKAGKESEKQKEQKPVKKEITLTDFEEILNTFLFDFANSPIEGCEPKEFITKYSTEILKAAYKELNAQLQQDIFEAKQEGRREGYEAARAEEKENLIMANSPQLKEQKPEWSEEDEKMLGLICANLLDATRHSIRLTMDSVNEMCDWLRTLQCRPLVSTDWNDEDQTLLSDALGCVTMVQELKKLGELKDFHISCTGEELRSWIRSLKSRPRKCSWKPSEEQMKALRKAVKKLAKTDVSDSISLSLMYDDLMERM